MPECWLQRPFCESCSRRSERVISLLTYIQQPFQLLSMVLWFETYAGKKDHLFDPVSGFLLNEINDATGEAKCTHTNFIRDCRGTALQV